MSWRQGLARGVVVALVVGACSAGPTQEQGSTGETPAVGGSMTVAIGSAPENLNPNTTMRTSGTIPPPP